MLQFHLHGQGVQIASQLLTMVPYLSTIFVVVLISRNSEYEHQGFYPIRRTFRRAGLQTGGGSGMLFERATPRRIDSGTNQLGLRLSSAPQTQ
jgi:hypothetical protein